MATKVNWPAKRLGNIAEFRNGVNYNKNSFGEGVKVVGVSDFQDYTKPRYDELAQINPEGIVSERNILRDGDIIFVRSNGNRELIGRSLFIEKPPEEVTYSAFTIRLRFTAREVYPKFYAYCFRTPLIRKGLTAYGGGTNISNLNQDILNRLEVPFPPRDVQQRIAGILSAYDELIENSQRRIKILETMARALYREWFVNFRFPGHEKVTRIPSPLGEIPKGWEVKPVESFCSLVTRGVTPKYEEGSGRFIINQKVNRGAELSLDDLKELAADLEVPSERFARFGDVLVNCLGEGTIGRVHFYIEDHQDWAVDQHMSICRAPRADNALYVYFAMESEKGQGRIAALKTGGTNMTMFNISALRSFALVAPPAKLLVRFAEIVWPMLRQKQALIKRNRNLRRTRDLLLPRLLSGQVELKEN